MKRRYALLVIIVIAIITFVSVRFGSQRRPVKSPVVVTSERLAPKAPGPRRLGEVIIAPVNIPNPLAPSEACLNLWKDLETMDFESLGAGISGETKRVFSVEKPGHFVQFLSDTIDKSGCAPLPEKHPLAKTQSEFVDACRLSASLEREAEKTGRSLPQSGMARYRCMSLALSFRYQLVYEQTASTPIEDISDLGVLAHQSFHLISQGNNSYAGATAVNERILRLDPRNADAAEALLNLRYVAFMRAKTDSERKEAEKHFERAVERMQEISPEDPSIISSQAGLYYLKGDARSLRLLGEKLREVDPKSEEAIRYETLAETLAKGGKPDEHSAYLPMLWAGPMIVISEIHIK